MNISNINLIAEKGYVMGFDVSFHDAGVRFHQISLMRPDKAPDELWLYFPKSEISVVSMTRATKRKVGEAAADIYNKLRGTNLKFTLPQRVDEPVLNAGLKRMLRISAEEEETLRKAGV
ncbi:hypothetical protein LJR030_000510 [Rhizobium sp. LjRoot30]|uniref:hypothetical protein n=1 Tax=Rhizobium sp. LjRoot30 TaxID=3342320 RepID=UPI003ED07488